VKLTYGNARTEVLCIKYYQNVTELRRHTANFIYILKDSGT